MPLLFREITLVALILLFIITFAHGSAAEHKPNVNRRSLKKQSKISVPGATSRSNVPHSIEPVPDSFALVEPEVQDGKNMPLNLLSDNPVDILGTTPTATPTAFPPPAKTTTNYEFKPDPCIRDESEIAYVNGIISPTQTFINCLNNIADPYSVPTFYNGSVNGVMIVYNSLQLNNLHSVSFSFATETQ